MARISNIFGALLAFALQLMVVKAEEEPTCSVGLYDGCWEGHEVHLNDGDWSLHDKGIAYMTSSLSVNGHGCKVALYTDDGGESHFTEGDYDCDRFEEVMNNDTATYIRIWHEEPKCHVGLYDGCWEGHEVHLTEGDWSLHDKGIAYMTSSLSLNGHGCKVALYADDGREWHFTEGEYDCGSFDDTADGDTATYIRIWYEEPVPNCTVVLYDGCNEGHEVHFNDGDWSLHDKGIAYMTSSLQVFGTNCKVALYADDGRESHFTEGEYDCDRFGAEFDDNAASYIRIWHEEPNCSVALYDGCWEGHEVHLNDGEWSLHDKGIAYMTSSLSVNGHGCKVALYADDGREWHFTEGDYDCGSFDDTADGDTATYIRIWHEESSGGKCVSIKKSLAEEIRAVSCPTK
jgi:hypothetical protein